MTDHDRPSDPPHEAVLDIAWRQAPYIAFSGACMGTADVVPGVSGGTMAVALGIYRRLLAAITSANVDLLRAVLSFQIPRALSILHWRFLATLLLGLGTAVAIMVKIVRLPHLIDAYPSHVYATFFGLVLASTIVLARRLPHWSYEAYGAIVGGTIAGFGIVNLVPTSTPDTALFVFACGVLAICAMILPGISGSFILLILGKYEYVLGALGRLDLAVILPFVVGCAVGITTFSRVLGWMLDRWHDPMVAALTGLLIGSLWRIWPYQHLTKIEVRGKLRVIEADPYWPAALDLSVVALVLAGLASVLLIEHIAVQRRQRGHEG